MEVLRPARQEYVRRVRDVEKNPQPQTVDETKMQRVIIALAAIVALLAVAPMAVDGKKNKKPALPLVYFVNQSAPACASLLRSRKRARAH